MFRLVLLTSVLCCLTVAVRAEDGGVNASHISDARIKELRHLLKHDCGACHGMTMQGGLGTALTPQAIQNKPDDSLIATVLFGRPGTPMPQWNAHLTEQEAAWMVAQLRQGDAP